MKNTKEKNRINEMCNIIKKNEKKVAEILYENQLKRRDRELNPRNVFGKLGKLEKDNFGFYTTMTEIEGKPESYSEKYYIKTIKNIWMFD
jgi:hypothetical protein